MSEEKKARTGTTKPGATPKDETPEETIKRIMRERGKTRPQMDERRKPRAREGGSYTLKDGKLDVNGNDRKKGVAKK